MIATVAADGWAAVRLAVFARDEGCVAQSWLVFGKDKTTEPCRDQYGTEIPYDTFDLLEFDHVTLNGKRIDSEAFGVAACPWHHRLSQQWRTDSKTHRQAERAWIR